MKPENGAVRHLHWEPILYCITVLLGCIFAWYTLVARVGVNDFQIAALTKQIEVIANSHEKELTAMDELKDAINALKVELAEQRGVLRRGNQARQER